MVPALIALVAAFFLLHYLFASLTAHTTALLPTMLVDRRGDPRHERDWRPRWR